MNKRGAKYEDMAAQLLISKGYAIRARNWICSRFGEIDIIAEKDGITVFVEVRARTNSGCGTPIESISASKIGKIIRTAEAYIKKFSPQTDFRFDVITVVPGNTPKHIEDAFNADGYGY